VASDDERVFAGLNVMPVSSQDSDRPVPAALPGKCAFYPAAPARTVYSASLAGRAIVAGWRREFRGRVVREDHVENAHQRRADPSLNSKFYLKTIGIMNTGHPAQGQKHLHCCRCPRKAQVLSCQGGGVWCEANIM